MKDKNKSRNLMIFTEEDALAVLKYGGGNFITRDGDMVIWMDYGKNTDPNYPFVGTVIHYDEWGQQKRKICSWTKKGKYLHNRLSSPLDLFIEVL